MPWFLLSKKGKNIWIKEKSRFPVVHPETMVRLLFLTSLVLECPPHLSPLMFSLLSLQPNVLCLLTQWFLGLFSFFATLGPSSNFGTSSISFRQEPLVKETWGSTKESNVFWILLTTKVLQRSRASQASSFC